MAVFESGSIPPNVGSRELIVITARYDDMQPAPPPKIPLADALSEWGASMQPLFPGASDDAPEVKAFDGAPPLSAEMSRFLTVAAPDAQLESIAERLRQRPDIESAYIKPAGEAPALQWQAMVAPPAPPVATLDFTPRQNYLGPAPAGIGAAAAWAVAGGDGSGVKIIDLEWNWEAGHEDLRQNFHGLLFGHPVGGSDHGTSVLGVMGGDRNAFGVTGICPGAWLATGSFSVPTANAIRAAAAALSPGDILLLEIHRPGPRFNFQSRADQLGYIAIEWWPDDLLAIQYAVSRGVIVVEAAGNGAENLDDALYDAPAAGFPPAWRNPFKRAVDSGAVVVGAGAPPPNTHGRNWGPDRSRLGFSNYGGVIDAQGWGREVTSTGYGDLQRGPDPKRWYTDVFAGTSSASPIVAGALACAQGARRSAGKTPLHSLSARTALRHTGSPQQGSPTSPVTERIGNRPDLSQLLALP
jgi:hypothetical protein